MNRCLVDTTMSPIMNHQSHAGLTPGPLRAIVALGAYRIFIANALKHGATKRSAANGKFRNILVIPFNFIFSLTRHKQRGKM